MTPGNSTRLSGSFRDPSGFLFYREQILYRQINQSYRDHYDLLMSSGLYRELTEAGMLIPHEEVHIVPTDPDLAYTTIRPETIPFISYPYEWCFGQLKDAALTTLAIQKAALAHGMVLKDASAYNIQFHEGRPVLIDTLSFETYHEGRPWVAYRQFCQHFLAPLALMSYLDVRLGQLLRIHLDGIPLDLAATLLPKRTRFSFPLLTNIHLHAKSQRHYESKPVTSDRQMKRQGLMGLIDNLESAIGRLNWKPEDTVWADYYEITNYSDQANRHKTELVRAYAQKAGAKTIWDLGANDGTFSRAAAHEGASVVAFDFDPAAVEKNYRACRQNHDAQILPLLLDLTNPSPGIGWSHTERMSFIERGPVDLVLALALVHHLAIGNNVPFDQLAAFFAATCRWLVIEFVPKNDSQVKRMLSTREDVFDFYTGEDFERGFSAFFTIEEKSEITDSVRTLYLMNRR
ncbi:MAG: SAM-dependent methyltransferase [candidate division Zixibacteria bacterium]|nr:SAM-dependent methyltransferase [candidate division Zixibacteria bacterium]